MTELTVALIILLVSLGNCACMVVGALAYRLGRVETRSETTKESVKPTVFPEVVSPEVKAEREERRQKRESDEVIAEFERDLKEYERVLYE